MFNFMVPCLLCVSLCFREWGKKREKAKCSQKKNKTIEANRRRENLRAKRKFNNKKTLWLHLGIISFLLLLGGGLLEGSGILLELGGLLAVEAGVLGLAVHHAGAADLVEELLALLLGGAEGGLADLNLVEAAGLDARGDDTLDLGGLEAGLLAVLLDLAADNELSDVIIAGQVEELADLASALGTQAAGEGHISDALDGLLTGLHDGDVQAGDIGANDAATDRLAAALASATTPANRKSIVS